MLIALNVNLDKAKKNFQNTNTRTFLVNLSMMRSFVFLSNEKFR